MHIINKIAAFMMLIIIFASCNAQQKVKKELSIPAKVWYVPENNDYKNNDSDYSYNRMIESDNIAMFWHKEYGNNPIANSDSTKRFDPEKAIIECERFYNYYVNDLKLVLKGQSFTDKYKLLIYVFGGDESTAFGGGEGNIGVLWTPATRINKAPYGALAHEIGHSFQYLSNKDSKTGPKGPIMEMSAQYMLWQVYPEWMTFENYHLKDFLKGTHYAFLHPVNMYHSPYVLEYWSHKHGIEFWGNLSRSTQEGEDLVMTYKRINNITQDQFNDQMFDASRKFITWDMTRINAVSKPYRNIHRTKLIEIENGWHQIDSINTPQNYGYNGIKLSVPQSGTLIKLEFQGLAGTKGYNAIKTNMAGWRYGFLASLKNGERVYSKIYKSQKGTGEFKIPENTEYLWLVVSGAPTEHFPIIFNRHNKEQKLEEQWPYKIKLYGTTIDSSKAPF